MYQHFESRIIRSFIQSKKNDFMFSLISILSLLGISLGVAVIFTVMSVMNGFQTEIERKMLGLIPHATVMSTSDRSDDEKLHSVLNTKDYVKSYSVFIHGEALAISDIDFEAIQIKSFNRDSNVIKNKLSVLMSSGNANDLFESPFNVLIGKGLAENLDLQLGDKLTIMTEDDTSLPFGAIPRLKEFNIVGIFESGVFELDRHLVFSSLEDAKLFFQIQDEFTGTDIEYFEPQKASIYTRQISIESGGGFLATDWTRENPNFFRSLELTKKIIFIVLILILGVAWFNIVSTLIMLTRQKRSNIAVLRSMGIKNKSLYKVFLTLGFFLGFLGSIIGSVLGFLVSMNLSSLILTIETIFDINLYQPEIYFLSEIPIDIIWTEVLGICFIAVILSMLSAFIPSYNATKINPSELLKLNR